MIRRIKRTELEDLVDPMEGQYMLWQPQPEKVEMSDGLIRVESSRRFGTFPLESSDFFTSFAKLAAHGEPSEKRIRRWVSRFGLPVRDLDVRGLASMSAQEFRDEARYAHDLLDVYLEIREEDAAAIKSRIRSPESRLDREFRAKLKANRRRWALYPGPDMGRELSGGMTYQELRDGMTLLAAQSALGEIVTALVGSVRLRAGVQRGWTLTPSYECPDLLTALYLQLFLLITKNKPLRYCEHCGEPFEATRQNKRFCDATCRSNGRPNTEYTTPNSTPTYANNGGQER